MDLTDLRIFKTVAEEGGISRAAHKLHRVPSNISTRVRQLEQSVGAQLFVREKQRLFLSPSGEHLLSYADQLLRLSAEALDALSKAPPRGVLRLGSLESTAASRLPRALAAFHKAWPEVRVELTTGTNDALTGAVLERRLDAAFVAEVPASKELVARRLFHERLIIISSLDHRPIRHPHDVEGDSVIVFPNGCAYRRTLQHWLGSTRVASVRVLELASYHAIVACVASGTGIALIPESVLDTVQRAAVARHALPKVHGELTTPLIWRSGDRSPALLALHRIVSGGERARC